jgi:hypothetical protein
MTVISTIITKWCTVIASDSFITEDKVDGTKKLTESQKSKIARIAKFRGSASYWGLATFGSWNTQDWLQTRCTEAHKYDSFESFARALRDALDRELSKLKFTRPLQRGIGIHLTGYEFIDGYWIPELFLCSNYKDTSYSELCCLHLTRETYHTVCKEKPDEKHKEPTYRHGVRDFLNDDGMLIFNNGDPVMFNPTANAFLKLMTVSRERGLARTPDSLDVHRALVRWPIEIVSAAQRDFYRDNVQIVGGKIHDLVITPNGDYSSSSGD